MEDDQEDLTKDDGNPGLVVKAEEFVEDDEGPIVVDAVVFGKREMQGSVVLKSRQSSFSGQGNLTFRKRSIHLK